MILPRVCRGLLVKCRQGKALILKVLPSCRQCRGLLRARAREMYRGVLFGAVNFSTRTRN